MPFKHLQSISIHCWPTNYKHIFKFQRASLSVSLGERFTHGHYVCHFKRCSMLLVIVQISLLSVHANVISLLCILYIYHMQQLLIVKCCPYTGTCLASTYMYLERFTCTSSSVYYYVSEISFLISKSSNALC